jgi:hypothetical protein
MDFIERIKAQEDAVYVEVFTEALIGGDNMETAEKKANKAVVLFRLKLYVMAMRLGQNDYFEKE